MTSTPTSTQYIYPSEYRTVSLPPDNQVFADYNAVRKHLEQVPSLFYAFESFYEDEKAYLTWIDEWCQDDANVVDYFTWLKEEHEVPELLQTEIFKLVNVAANWDGCGLLASLYLTYAELVYDDSEDEDEPTPERIVEMLIEDIKLLEAATEDTSFSHYTYRPGHSLSQSAYSAAFEGDYMDPHGLIPHYCRKISVMMDEWVKNPKNHIAPYTSVISSSMMGKSRLIKEIAMEIPTIYICLRKDENDSGYPIASDHSLIDYIFHNTVRKGDKNPEATAVKHFQRLLLGFLRLIRKFSRVWTSDSSEPQFLAPHSVRFCLWYILAEPNTDTASDYLAEIFPDPNLSQDLDLTPKGQWKNVIRSIENDAEDLDIHMALAEEWKRTAPYLSQHSTDGKPLLLVVWDEARALVEAGIDGERRRQESSISKFRLLRRAMGSIGKINSDSPIRIFTLFTDTTSRINNFQPTLRSSPYTDRRLSAFGDRRLFDPIVIMPTWDYHANYNLKTTIDPDEVAQIERLIQFGRSAWYSLLHNEDSVVSSNSLLKTAVEKLTLTPFNKESLSAKFDVSSPLDEATRLTMLAVIGCRLAIQTGSYVSLMQELVASHMMVLLRIIRHEQVEALYPSEPILAVASSILTANFGWVRPLQTLITSLRHGIVGKGFRGEFVTKVLLCMAMEDALRIGNDQKGLWDSENDEDEEETLWQFRPVSTDEFLSALLRCPGLDQDPDKETSRDNGDTRKDPEASSAGDLQANLEPKRDATKATPKQSTFESDLGKKTEETIQDVFDDWDSDEDDIPGTTGSDGEPKIEDPKFFDAVIKEIEGWNPLRRSTRKPSTGEKRKRETSQKQSTAEKIQEMIQTVADGMVFFNHFVCLNTKLRPSILLKAWNKGAALMTQANTPGIDVAIPVRRAIDETDEAELDLGPLSGEWTPEQEKNASRIMSCIFFDSKNDLSMTDTTIRQAAEKCRPTSHNFVGYKFSNHFISLVLSYGSTPFPDGPVKIFRSSQSELSGKQLLHLKIGARGISADTYKCLQNRPNAERLLSQLLEMNRNPLRELSGRRNKEIRNGIIDCLALQCDPRREFTFSS